MIQPTTFIGLDFKSKQDAIIDFICNETNSKIEDVISTSRKGAVKESRHLCCFFLRKKTKLNLKQIGEIFSGRDHSTVIHSCEYVTDSAKVYENYKSMLNQLEDKLDKYLLCFNDSCVNYH